jgi:hypothetical protein
MVQCATHKHVLKCVCVKMMVYKYLLKSIWAESSDNNVRVCKPEYFISVW